MDVALNNLKRLIRHKTQTTNQPNLNTATIPVRFFVRNGMLVKYVLHYFKPVIS